MQATDAKAGPCFHGTANFVFQLGRVAPLFVWSAGITPLRGHWRTFHELATLRIKEFHYYSAAAVVEEVDLHSVRDLVHRGPLRLLVS